MMPFYERLKYARIIAWYMFLGFLAPCLFAFSWAMLIDWLVPDQDDDLLLVILFFGVIVVCLFGAVFGLGVFLGALLWPVVSVMKLFWIGAAALGFVIAGTSIVILIHSALIDIELILLICTCPMGFFAAIAMRVLGMTLGWSRHWTPPGACESCGYDLRETPLGGNCPECGAAGKAFVRVDSK